MQHEYVAKPLDAYSVVVQKAWTLAEPTTCYEQVDSRGRHLCLDHRHTGNIIRAAGLSCGVVGDMRGTEVGGPA